MLLPRSAGILLHPTSLPGPGPVGEFGPDLLRFLDWAAESGFTLWQLLPLGPTGFGNSPYQCYSAFAGNPLLIASPRRGATDPISKLDAAAEPPAAVPTVDYALAARTKRATLQAQVAAFVETESYQAFVAAESVWLDDYALFMSLKERFDGMPWTSWAPALVQREPSVIARWRKELHAEIRAHTVQQYFFFRQFAEVKRAAAARGIRLMGDVPIYVAHDSADVWAHPQLFDLEPDGSLRVQAGVPPDYFSPTGQLWGNPLYRWDAHAATGYDWWIARMRSAFRMFDVVRLDHFRGFASYWEIAGDAATAASGQWRPGPGRALFDALTAALGPLPLIAEDLGDITDDVRALLKDLELPGMAVLQFAFGDDNPAHGFLPHNHVPSQVVYTGTHDNDTTLGWWNSRPSRTVGATSSVATERDRVEAYVGHGPDPMPWPIIRLALGSVARVAIVPMQDVLSLDAARRMNTPGVTNDNWTFRFDWSEVPANLAPQLRNLLHTFGRIPAPLAAPVPPTPLR